MNQPTVVSQRPVSLTAQLDALRTQDYTVSGYIRSLIERDLKKGR